MLDVQVGQQTLVTTVDGKGVLYLVDQNGQIRYAYSGALEWDSQENITITQSLLKRL